MTDIVEATAALVAATGEIIGTKAEVLAWSVGTVDGGPSGNGNYPFTAADGTVVTVPCPAKIAAMNGDPVAAAATLQAKVDAAEDAVAAAEATAASVAETYDQYAFTAVPRPDIVLAETDAHGKAFNIVRADGRHEHKHRVGSIATSELAAAATIGNLPDAITPPRGDFPLVATDSTGRRLWGVDHGGSFYGPKEALAERSEVAIASAPAVATGYLRRRKFVSIATAETRGTDPTNPAYNYTADAVTGCWARLPDIKANLLRVTNPLAEILEFRRATIDLDGINYRGTWNPASGKVTIPSDQYRPRVGWFWQVSTTSGGFTAGDRVVLIGANASSTAFATAAQAFVMADGTTNAGDTPAGMLFRHVKASAGRFYRGEWSPASGAYPADANLQAGDSYSVSAAGTYSGVTYAYGDYLVKTAAGWKREVSGPITEVAVGSTAEFLCLSGTLRDWTVRKKTNSGATSFFDVDIEAREPVTARVQTIAGRRQLWLHFADGSVDKLSTANVGNSYAPQFDGDLLLFKSDRTGEELTYQLAPDRVPGKFGLARRAHLARSSTILTVGDSYGVRWGAPFIRQVELDDTAKGRKIAREGLELSGGSLDEHYIASIVTAMGEDIRRGDYLSGIVCYILDWNNGTVEERAAITRALAAIRSRTPRLLVAGNMAGRTISWNGSAVVCTSGFVGNAAKIADEARLEEMMGGEVFDGGNFANMRKWTISTRNPRFSASDWDPVLQMTVGDVATTLGIWGLWTLVDPADPNYPAMRTNLTQARFKGYHANVASLPGSAADWDYYVANGLGDTSIGSVRYWLGGQWNYLDPGDGVHLPAANPPYYTSSAILNVTTDGDTSAMMNMMAYDVVNELAARGWLD